MSGGKRTQAEIVGQLEAERIAAMLGQQLKAARIGRRLTQDDLGRRVGVRQSRMSEIERGRGASLPLGTWVALGIAVGRPLAVSMSRPLDDEGPADRGHLDIQEGLTRLLRRHGWPTMVELATRPHDPAHSVDVAARDGRGRYILLEAWNQFGDLGASIRSTDRKVAEFTARAPDGDVRQCWVIRATAANRRLVRRYPALLQSRFPGSSRLWARALNEGADPPAEPGIVWWADGRVVELRWPS